MEKLLNGFVGIGVGFIPMMEVGKNFDMFNRDLLGAAEESIENSGLFGFILTSMVSSESSQVKVPGRVVPPRVSSSMLVARGRPVNVGACNRRAHVFDLQ